MLTPTLIEQVKSLIPLIKRNVVFTASLDDSKRSHDMRELLDEVAALSPKISVEEATNDRTPSFSISSPGIDTDIRFAGLPMGHEFASFMLAMVQVGGHAPKIDDATRAAIEAIDTDCHFVTYMSLSCQNCPEVVQSLNLMAVVNPKIHHTAVEGGAFKDEVDAHDVKSVPAVFKDGKYFASGRMAVNDFLSKLGDGSNPGAKAWRDQKPFDVLVAGGGPAGVTAAIYAARKGLRVGLAASRIGGQVLDTAGIENLITIAHAEGPQLGATLAANAKAAGVTVMEPLAIEGLEKSDNAVSLKCQDDVTLTSKTVVIATGAKYRKLGVPGEEEYLTKGVTFCPHCDGPLFKGKDVAVVGGGNSGIEAAIDLAGVTRHVTVIEFLPACRADKVLLDAAAKLDNLDIITNAAVQAVEGDGKEVTGITYQMRDGEEKTTLPLSGVFIQVGLVPQTEWLKSSGVELNRRGEIVTNERGATNIDGVFAAGDCSDSPYKQIVTALGSGATASLSAYEHVAIGR